MDGVHPALIGHLLDGAVAFGAEQRPNGQHGDGQSGGSDRKKQDGDEANSHCQLPTWGGEGHPPTGEAERTFSGKAFSSSGLWRHCELCHKVRRQKKWTSRFQNARSKGTCSRRRGARWHTSEGRSGSAWWTVKVEFIGPLRGGQPEGRPSWLGSNRVGSSLWPARLHDGNHATQYNLPSIAFALTSPPHSPKAPPLPQGTAGFAWRPMSACGSTNKSALHRWGRYL